MAELNDEETMKLIELYRGQENLFNHTLAVYSDRDATRESLLYIASAMGKGWDTCMTKARLKWLRNGYTRNLGMIQASKKSGAGRDDIVKVKWKWFSLLDFLRPYCKVTAKGVSNLPDSQDSLTQPSQTIEAEDQASDHIENSQSVDPEDDYSGPSTCDRQIQRLIKKNTPSSQPLHGHLSPLTVVTSGPEVIEQYSQPSGTSTSSSTPPSSGSRPPSPENGGLAPPPDFARLERKRKLSQSAGSGQAMALLQDVAVQIKENAKRRRQQAAAATAPRSNNEKFCLFLAAQMDNMTKHNQIKMRKKINDLLYEIDMDELDTSE